MHDQEPLSEVFAGTYRKVIATVEKNLPGLKWCNDAQIVAGWFRTSKIPIICHSEINSEDVALYRDNLFVDCYYWYHGMIAADWFRGYKWQPDLQVRDRSGSARRFLLYARDTTGTRQYRRKIIDGLEPIRSQVLFDWDQSREIDSTASAMIDIEDANRSAVQIVAETVFETSKVHLTEKVFKPMVMGQPFVLFAGPGALEYLKDYGFQTFDSVWNEDYDCELDHQRRLDKILDLIRSLASMNQAGFQDLFQKILPILDHNRRWFYSDQFQDHLAKEMFQNFDIALERQAELIQEYPGGQLCWLMSGLLDRDLYPCTNWRTYLGDYLLANRGNLDQVFARYPSIRNYADTLDVRSITGDQSGPGSVVL